MFGTQFVGGRPMTDEHRHEQLSRAYAKAVRGVVGLERRADRAATAADMTVGGIERSERCLGVGPAISHIQLKSRPPRP